MPENMQNPFCLSIPSAELRPGQGEPGETQDLAPSWVSVQQTEKLSQGGCPGDGLREGWRQGCRQHTARGCNGFTVQGKGYWQPWGQRGGARRIVRWPHTESRGVRAIVPGTSLRREAGRRNTSQEETLWERSAVSGASWTCVPSVSQSPRLSTGPGGVSLLPPPVQESQPHPWEGVWG